MNDIKITATEEVGGLTVSLAFSISCEALARELLVSPDDEVLLDIPCVLKEKLLQAVQLVMIQEIGSIRTKLHVSLISAATKDLREQREATPTTMCIDTHGV